MRSVRGPLDWTLLSAVGLLLCVGLFMVYSSSMVIAFNEFNDDTYFVTRQLTWIAIGLSAMAVLARINYHTWRRFSLLFLVIGIVLLGAVLIPGLGAESYGSARWLRVGAGLQIQPSEWIKLILVIYMADWLARKGRRVREFFFSSLPFLIILGGICCLVVLEPDFGTTVVIAATAISIFFVAGANLWHFAPAIMGIVAVLGYVMTMEAYRVDRINAWLDPWQDKQGIGWHTVQTLIALGSGGLTGLGLGASRQKHYWLVNSHTDAIVAILGEELGLVGTLTVLALFGVVTWRGMVIAYRAPDTFGRLLAAGATTMIFWQAAINLAVVTNSAPYTGVTLPFVSFGGNSQVVSLAAVGLLLSVGRFREVVGVKRVETPPSDSADDLKTRRRTRQRPTRPTISPRRSLEAPASLMASSQADWPRR